MLNRYQGQYVKFGGYGALAAALLLGVACQRAQAEPSPLEKGSEAARSTTSGELVIQWNEVAFELAKRADGYQDPFPHLRTLTMMHLAMHDAVNGVTSTYERYAATVSDAGADPAIAAAAAAHAVLKAVHPAQSALLDAKLSQLGTAQKNVAARERGMALGKAAAQAILRARASDRSDAVEQYTAAAGPGRYRFVPPLELVYRPAWRSVQPFALASGDQFRSKPPPSLDSAEYASAFEEVRNYGRATDARRTPDQTFYADWWYELSEVGWNRIARVTWSEQGQRDLWFTARLFALVNVGLMDAYIAGWDSKLHYDFWRPYTAVRAAATDKNPATVAERGWQPYCVTPPVQDYPSTHSALGAAGAAILHGVYGRDVPFTMESTSSKPPGAKRSFSSFRQAASENADSRVACGIHFRFATREGLSLGERVGEHTLRSLLQPIRR
jgi:hypothetical protein